MSGRWARLRLGLRLGLRRPRWRLRRRDGGGLAIEAALIAPSVVALVLVAVAAGRVQTAAGTVEAAARSGARTASLQRDPAAREKPARESALATLSQQGVVCSSSEVHYTTGELVLPGGNVTTVTVTVVCEVELSDLLGGPTGLGVTKRLEGRFTSVVDRYRGQ
ncbi:TadE/TadG family type IV pilus assembly protein [Streptomyces sp. NRRL WC-3742]|uniref:TadE/TadG family type IV pilus assembly protein n=1 Tax=Streptomyces sp. NRRL WC-3742 TaxID=1463934 RepID=UPI00068BC982|nr:TadE/TadG family type IV pilus assembly protein [Streptomyces sp. NRRL WC-3742]